MGHRSYASKRRDPVTFDIDGTVFTARGGVPLLELAELGSVAELRADSPEGMAAVNAFFRFLLGDEEFERFRVFCAAPPVVDPETLLEVLADLFADVVGHPLERPSDSSDGPTTTGHTLKVISLSDGTVTEMPLSREREAELRAQASA